jgi:hypothetical protein
MTLLRNQLKDYIAPSGLLPSGNSSTECPRGKPVDTECVVLKLRQRPSNSRHLHCGGIEHDQFCGSYDGWSSICILGIHLLSHYFHCSDFVSRFVKPSLS